MLKIIKNPDENKYNEVTEAVKNADGYCPCMLQRTPETKCVCKHYKDKSLIIDLSYKVGQKETDDERKTD